LIREERWQKITANFGLRRLKEPIRLVIDPWELGEDPNSSCVRLFWGCGKQIARTFDLCFKLFHGIDKHHKNQSQQNNF